MTLFSKRNKPFYVQAYLQFFKRYPKALAFGYVHALFSSFGQTFFIAFYGSYILKDLGLSNTTYGSIYAGATLLSSFTLSYFGELIDRYNYKIISLLVAAGLACGAFFLSISNNIYWLALSFFMLRLFGQGLCPLLASTVMAKVFIKNRGKSLAISNLGNPSGEALLPILLIQPLLQGYTWQESWQIISCLILVLFPLTSLLFSKDLAGEERIRFGKDVVRKKFSRIQLLKDKKFYLLVPTASMNAFILTAVFFHLSFVNEAKAWSPSLAAGGFLAFGITRAISGLVSGDFIDRFPVFTLVKFYLIPIILGLLSMLLPTGSLGVYIFFILCGFSVGFSANLFTAIWVEIYGTDFLGAIRGLLSTCIVVSTAISPPLMGWAIDSSWSIQSIISALLLIVLFSYILLLKHPMRTKS